MQKNPGNSLSVCVRFWIINLALLLLTGCAQAQIQATPEIKVPRITKEEVRSMLGNPDLIILDVRTARDWKGSGSKIQGAVRENPEVEVGTWTAKYPKDKTLVLYCA